MMKVKKKKKKKRKEDLLVTEAHIALYICSVNVC